MTFTSSSKTRHSSRCVHQLPLSWESTDRACAHQLLEGLCILNQSPAAPALLASTPLLGFSKDCPFIDISQRASTPGGLWLDANILPFATFDLGLPPPGSFRPCRSSRLRRFSPLVRRRLVASCSRSWGSLRFRFLLPRMSWVLPGLLQTSSASSFECLSAFPQCTTRAYQSRATLRRLSLQRSRAWWILLRLWKRLQAVLPRALFFRSFLSLARLVLPLFQLPSPPGSSPVERDHRGGRALGRPLSSLLPQLLRFSIAGSPLPPCPPCLAFALPLGPGLLDLRVLIRVGVRREGACFQVPPSDPPMGFHSLRRS